MLSRNFFRLNAKGGSGQRQSWTRLKKNPKNPKSKIYMPIFVSLPLIVSIGPTRLLPFFVCLAEAKLPEIPKASANASFDEIA